MASLDELRVWLASLLQDPQALIYDAASLDSSLRMALREYNLACGKASTVQGLDGATDSSLIPEHEGVIVLGAAGFAAGGRVARRAEAFNLGQAVPQGLAAWSADALQRFHALLETIRQGSLQGASTPGWETQGWPVDGWEEQA